MRTLRSSIAAIALSSFLSAGCYCTRGALSLLDPEYKHPDRLASCRVSATGDVRAVVTLADGEPLELGDTRDPGVPALLIERGSSPKRGRPLSPDGAIGEPVTLTAGASSTATLVDVDVWPGIDEDLDHHPRADPGGVYFSVYLAPPGGSAPRERIQHSFTMAPRQPCVGAYVACVALVPFAFCLNVVTSPIQVIVWLNREPISW